MGGMIGCRTHAAAHPSFAAGEPGPAADPLEPTESLTEERRRAALFSEGSGSCRSCNVAERVSSEPLAPGYGQGEGEGYG